MHDRADGSGCRVGRVRNRIAFPDSVRRVAALGTGIAARLGGRRRRTRSASQHQSTSFIPAAITLTPAGVVHSGQRSRLRFSLFHSQPTHWADLRRRRRSLRARRRTLSSRYLTTVGVSCPVHPRPRRDVLAEYLGGTGNSFARVLDASAAAPGNAVDECLRTSDFRVEGDVCRVSGPDGIQLDTDPRQAEDGARHPASGSAVGVSSCERGPFPTDPTQPAPWRAALHVRPRRLPHRYVTAVRRRRRLPKRRLRLHAAPRLRCHRRIR